MRTNALVKGIFEVVELRGLEPLTFSLRRHRVHMASREHHVINVHVAEAEAPWLQRGGTPGAHGGGLASNGDRHEPSVGISPAAITRVDRWLPQVPASTRAMIAAARGLVATPPGKSIEMRLVPVLPVHPVVAVAAWAPRWRRARDARAPHRAARSDGLCSSALPPLSRARSAP